MFTLHPIHHGLLTVSWKCPLRPYFQSRDFKKCFLILVVCPPVSQESLSSPLGLSSLWTLGSESKCSGTAWSIIKLARWNPWAEFKKKRKTKKQGLSVTGISVYAGGWMKTDRREKIRILNFRIQRSSHIARSKKQISVHAMPEFRAKQKLID